MRPSIVAATLAGTILALAVGAVADRAGMPDNVILNESPAKKPQTIRTHTEVVGAVASESLLLLTDASEVFILNLSDQDLCLSTLTAANKSGGQTCAANGVDCGGDGTLSVRVPASGGTLTLPVPRALNTPTGPQIGDICGRMDAAIATGAIHIVERNQ